MTVDVDTFESNRAHLLRVGYRITGSRSDAEDAVQEAWLRFAAQDPATIDEPRAWLTTVVGRLCLDRLRSAAARRERYVGPWLPEPLVTTPADDDPLAEVVRDEGVRMAAMVVLERLTPPQRVALVLHEALDLPFARIAEVLDCSEATARQHASRARRIVADADVPPPASSAEQLAVLQAFADALARADTDGIVALLHPDVVLLADSDGRVSAARRPIVGPADVARLFLGLLRKYGDGLLADWEPILVNGEPGVRTPAVGTAPASVAVLSVTDGRIRAMYQVVNPDKL
ncbi:RNA polymerase sigma factor SigJ [Pseudonocardia dioxanivorans]|uniref:RNA polymerase sigma factor SigJ n=1 Tax=Pseudonocardia dioxanivorans TaxID=240495 RepID=UPI000CCFE9E0|nr:RNA polymerase sigma factor SigJ [Pseudonocardia dioxanivorans]